MTSTNSVKGYPYVLGVHKLFWKVENVTDNMSTFDMYRMDWHDCRPTSTVECANKHLQRLHKKQFWYKGKKTSSVFDYSNRQIWYNVTDGEWNTLAVNQNGSHKYPNGPYRMFITAEDWFGNQLVKTLNVRVNN